MRIRGVRIGYMTVLVMALVMVLSGCAESSSDWVVNSQTETVKPRTGVVLDLKTYEGYRGFDWVDNGHFLAYKESQTGFGTDRGLAVVNLSDGKVREYITTKKQVRKALLSPDKKQLVYSVSGEGTQSGFLVHKDLSTGVEKTYAYDAWAFESQGPWLEGQSLLLPKDVTAWAGEKAVTPFQFWRMDQTGVVKSFSLEVPRANQSDAQMYLFKCFESSKEIYSVVGGSGVSSLFVHDRISGMGRKFPGQNIEDAGKNPADQSLYLLQSGQNYSDKTLSVLKDQKESIDVVTHSDIKLPQWSPTGKVLLYALVTPQLGTEIHMVDLVSRSSHLVMTYDSERVESLSMSPDEKYILVRLGPGSKTQILRIK